MSVSGAVAAVAVAVAVAVVRVCGCGVVMVLAVVMVVGRLPRGEVSKARRQPYIGAGVLPKRTARVA